MPVTFYGKNGRLRLYDSTKGRDLSQSGPKEVHISNEVSSVHNNITANMLDPNAGTNTILAVASDHVYVGNLFPFSRITVDLSSLASADGGALVLQYWNGSTWVAVGNLVDGTAVGGNTMRQDGVISFDDPANWAINDVPAAGTNLFYIRMHSTSNFGTDPVAQLIEPSSGQFYEVVFAAMNLTAPEGRNRPEEMIRLNRGRLDSAGHYIQGLDDPIVEPMPLSFAALLDSIYNKAALAKVLACQNAGITTWPKVGISTKTDTQIPAGLTGTLVSTPAFTDPSKKAICVQAVWDDLNGERVFREYNECHIPSGSVTLTEAPDSVTLQLEGGIYGSIRDDLTNFGYRW